MEALGSSSASESPGPADDEESPPRSRSSAFPNKAAGGGHDKLTAPTHAISSAAGGVAATTAPSANISSTSPATKLGRHAQRRRRACPLREQLLRSCNLPVPPPNPDHDHSGPESETATARCSTIAGVAAAGPSSSPPSPSPRNLECIIAPPSSPSPFVFENETAPLSSPATSTASETPGWAERAGLTAGAGAGGRPPDARRSWWSEVNNSNTDTGDVCSTGRKNYRFARSGRDVPRFLRPVMLMLTMSILAMVGTMIGREGWRGTGMFGLHNVFGPAVHAAGGAKLQEAVVDDIFDRADKDHDGVIADEEIQYVSVCIRLFSGADTTVVFQCQRPLFDASPSSVSSFVCGSLLLLIVVGTAKHANIGRVLSRVDGQPPIMH